MPRLRATRLSAISQAVRRLDFSPAALFAASEPGVWYDPSDLGTLFQDANGTTPVTAVGQPVGLVLDKSRSARWVDVTGAVWTKTAGDGVVTVNGNQITITGATTATQVTRTAGDAPFVPGRMRMSIRADYVAATGVQRWLRGIPVALANGVVRSDLVALDNSSLERLDVSTGTATFTILSFDYWVGNHATQSTAGSRPLLQQDGSGRYFLEFDGVDDSLVTPTITPGSDKAQVFSGVRKLNDTAAIVAEFSTNVSSANGSFYHVTGTDAGGLYSALARGTSNVSAFQAGTSNTPAPDTSVLTALHDIAGHLSRVRRNGVVGTDGVADKGAGNFLAYPLYIGARAGTSLFFNGRLYSFITRFGPNLSADQIAATEAWVNTKTGAY